MARVDAAAGLAALRAWIDQGEELPRAETLAAARFSLAELEKALPGRSVEVRVPPAGAVQVFGGTRHRRGTPPAVVELDVQTWLGLAVGSLTWDQADAAGLIDASGQRADLSDHLPLFTELAIDRSCGTQ